MDIGATIDNVIRCLKIATSGGLHPAVAQLELDAPSVQQLFVSFTQQNHKMEHMIAMMQHDRPEIKAERFANVRLNSTISVSVEWNGNANLWRR